MNQASHLSLLFSVMFWIGFPAAAIPAETDASPACPAIRIDRADFTAEDRKLICKAATTARSFFQSHGVDIRQSLRIRSQDEQAASTLPHIGSYSTADKTVSLQSFEQASGKDGGNTLFGLPLDKILYESVVVHEIAHAIADQHFTCRPPPLVAQEYLAYVAQLSTMEQTTRERILIRNGRPAYEGIGEMSPTYYALDPSGFGIKAYRHFVALTDPGEFIRGLLSGRLQPTDAEAE